MNACPTPPSVPLAVRAWAWVLGLWCLTLAWDAAGWDLAVVGLWADARGFPWRHHWGLERVLHDAARHLATGLYLALWGLVWRPLGPWRTLTRAQRLEVALGATWGLLAVNVLKRESLTSCPWDLQAFGGVARHVSHWRWGVADGGPGHCFPGGHASAALAGLALPLPWLASGEPAQRVWGRRALVAVLGLGVVLGLTQTVRGAHYPSHTLWTAALCATLAVLNHRVWRRATVWWVARHSRCASQARSSNPCSRSTDAGAATGACCHSQAQ